MRGGRPDTCGAFWGLGACALACGVLGPSLAGCFLADGDETFSPVAITITGYVDTSQANLDLLAFQDGDGPWQELAGAGGLYTFEVTHPEYGVAWVCRASPTTVSVRAYLLTTDEATALSASCNHAAAASTLTGNVSGLDVDEAAGIYAGTRAASPLATTASPGYSVMLFPGTYDVIAERQATTGRSLQLIRHTNVVVGTNGVTSFDFASEGFVPEEHVATIVGASAGEMTRLSSTILTHLGTSVTLYWDDPTGFLGVPESELLGNDVHRLGVSATDAAAGSTRIVQTYARVAADVTHTLPLLLDVPTVTTVATVPNVRLSATVVAPGDVDVYFLRQSQAVTGLRAQDLWITAGRVGAETPITLAFPPLDALASWDPTWSLVAGEATSWIVQAHRSNRGVADLLPIEPSHRTAPGLDGRLVSISDRFGQIVP